nr:YoaK family protein [uncultured Holophaga sp.]
MSRSPFTFLRAGLRRINHLLQGEADLEHLQKGAARTLDRLTALVPLDADLLMARGARRSHYLNRQLATSLAFTAGAVNAGGFLAVHAYTSHVSGTTSHAADALVLGQHTVALGAIATVACFCAGAASASILISYGKRHRYQSYYALSLMVEAILLLLFGLMGYRLQELRHFYLPLTVVLLSFLMGMHNSVVTTISSAEVRTTHMTGVVTDLGIEIGRALYFDLTRNPRVERVKANWIKLKLHALILASFFGGGVAGALGFKYIGFKVTLLLAGFLAFLALRPILHDLRVRWRLLRRGEG